MSDFLREASEWIAKPEDERDLRKGAELVLRITRNRIMYNNMMSRPERYAKHIEYQVQKWINRKTAAISHEQVEVSLLRHGAFVIVGDRHGHGARRLCLIEHVYRVL